MCIHIYIYVYVYCDLNIDVAIYIEVCIDMATDPSQYLKKDISKKRHLNPFKINGWNMSSWSFGRSFSFLNVWFVGSSRQSSRGVIQDGDSEFAKIQSPQMSISGWIWMFFFSPLNPWNHRTTRSTRAFGCELLNSQHFPDVRNLGQLIDLQKRPDLGPQNTYI